MKKSLVISIAVVIVFLLSSPVLAADKSTSDMPWEKGYVNLGAYFASLNTGFRLGLGNIGLGITLDAEDFLGLDTTDAAFRVDAGYRLGKSMRHKLDFSWFQFHRQAEKVLTEDVELPPELGGETLPTGMTASSLFDFDIYKIKYEYSFILDDRVDLNAGLGVFIMPMEFGLGEKGRELKSESITAPLPVFGIGFDIAMTPKWFLRQGIDLLFLELSNFKGSILNPQIALEYWAWEHVGFGVGLDGMMVNIEAKDDNAYPGIDFVGNAEFSYFGAQAYIKAYF
jgi:hypothetical protein